MIELPRRSVTRFFVPLIDVLILLFCIFLLMPFVSAPENQDPSSENNSAEMPMPTETEQLQTDLRKARAAVERLQRGLEEKVAVKVIEIDERTGELFHFVDGRREEIPTREAARLLTVRHRTQVAGRKPHYLILLPRRLTGKPTEEQVREYERWFQETSFDIHDPR